MRHALFSIAVAGLLGCAGAWAGQANPQGQEHGKAQVQQAQPEPAPPGQVVSECNHRANERKLGGEERKRYVEWCTERGERVRYEDKTWTRERSCYEKADAKRLSGDKRKQFLHECLGKTQSYDSGDKHPEYDPRGRDVLNKGSQK